MDYQIWDDQVEWRPPTPEQAAKMKELMEKMIVSGKLSVWTTTVPFDSLSPSKPGSPELDREEN